MPVRVHVCACLCVDAGEINVRRDSPVDGAMCERAKFLRTRLL